MVQPSSKTKKDILEHWANYFRELLNRTNPSDPSALEELLTLPQFPQLDLCPTLEEVHVAIKTLRTRNLLVKIQSLARYLNTGDHNLSTNSPNSPPYVVSKVRSLTPGRMPPSLLSTRGKVTDQTVVTAVASHFLMLQAKSLLVSCSIACSIILLTESSRNRRQDFGNNVAQLTPSL